MTDQIIKNAPLTNIPKEVLWLSAIILGVVVLSLALLFARFSSITNSATTLNEYLSKNRNLMVELYSDDFLTRETARQTISDFLLKSKIIDVKKEELLVGVIHPANVASRVAVLRYGEKATFKDTTGEEYISEVPWLPFSQRTFESSPVVYSFRRKK